MPANVGASAISQANVLSSAQTIAQLTAINAVLTYLAGQSVQLTVMFGVQPMSFTPSVASIQSLTADLTALQTQLNAALVAAGVT